MTDLGMTIGGSAVGDLIHEIYEKNREPPREHLGVSRIGIKCERRLWYEFRWITISFPGRMLRLFTRGTREEVVFVEELRAAGLTVSDTDHDGQQWRCSWLGGHFSGSCDGAVLGVPEAPKTWHLLECKTSNAKRFNELASKGVQASNEQHYVQMQCYMAGLDLKRYLYLVTCKDDDRIHAERGPMVPGVAAHAIDKAKRIIFAAEPLTKISEDPSWWECKFCDFVDLCQYGKVHQLTRNCRTCASSEPLPDGTWRCTWLDSPIPVEVQRVGCEHHVYLPKLIPHPAVDASVEGRSVTYELPGGERVLDHQRSLAIGGLVV